MGKIVSLTGKKAKSKYKYALNDELDKLPRHTTINDILIHLKKYGITKDKFYWDREIPFDSLSSIPEDRLFIYADVFDCEVSDLRNNPVKAKSIREKVHTKIKTRLS